MKSKLKKEGRSGGTREDRKRHKEREEERKPGRKETRDKRGRKRGKGKEENGGGMKIFAEDSFIKTNDKTN